MLPEIKELRVTRNVDVVVDPLDTGHIYVYNRDSAEINIYNTFRGNLSKTFHVSQYAPMKTELYVWSSKIFLFAFSARGGYYSLIAYGSAFDNRPSGEIIDEFSTRDLYRERALAGTKHGFVTTGGFLWLAVHPAAFNIFDLSDPIIRLVDSKGTPKTDFNLSMAYDVSADTAFGDGRVAFKSENQDSYFIYKIGQDHRLIFVLRIDIPITIAAATVSDSNNNSSNFAMINEDTVIIYDRPEASLIAVKGFEPVGEDKYDAYYETGRSQLEWTHHVRDVSLTSTVIPAVLHGKSVVAVVSD